VRCYQALFATPAHCDGAITMMADWDLERLSRDLPRLSTGAGHALLGWAWPGNPWTARYRRERLDARVVGRDELRVDADVVVGGAPEHQRAALERHRDRRSVAIADDEPRSLGAERPGHIA